jgi:hypothetical protein
VLHVPAITIHRSHLASYAPCTFVSHSLIIPWPSLRHPPPLQYKGARYLSFARDPRGTSEVGYIHLVYGLPGEPLTSSISDVCFG